MAYNPRWLNDAFDLGFSQADVDFVVPDLGRDLRLAIDPFLLYKSRQPELREQHDRLLSLFNDAIHSFGRGDVERASRLIQFPEVNEVGFGYSTEGHRGSGLGDYLNALVLETLAASPELVERGVRHVEEMQLVSLGIGADRVSDIAANCLKEFLIKYTQEQSELWGIPLERNVGVPNVFDFASREWVDGYYDLPVNKQTDPPLAILLVPRMLVRLLPWINFDDYQRLEFGTYLRAKEMRKVLSKPIQGRRPPKREIVAITRKEIERIDHYVDYKEKTAKDAEPLRLLAATEEICSQSDALIRELRELEPGRGQAEAYQDLLFRVFNFLFEPDLVDGRPQVRSEHGTVIRDLLYTNDSDKPFWDFIRNKHGNLTVVFELKNKKAIAGADVDQVARYLGDPLGYFGILAAREPWSDARRRSAIT